MEHEKQSYKARFCHDDEVIAREMKLGVLLGDWE